MKAKLLSGIAIVFLVFGITGVSQAALKTIGHGYHYDGTKVVKSALIWDKDIDANGNSLVWLDYSNPEASWGSQRDWSGGLEAQMLVELLPGYSVAWDENQWRLPSAGSEPQSGYNHTTSEMGHLYYDELGLLSYPDRGYQDVTDAELNASEFNNLIASLYWSGTEYADGPGFAWFLYMNLGYQNGSGKSRNLYGLAVRSGQVSAVPVPGAIWLLGSGLVGLAALKRKEKNRV